MNLATWAVLGAGSVAVLFAGLMLVQRSLYTSAVCLLVVLMQIAAIFYFVGAPLLGFMQVMIYAGAVMVLVVVTIMASPQATQRLWTRLSLPGPVAAAAGLLVLAEAGLLLWRGGALAGPAQPAFDAQKNIGAVLFGPYAVATEAVTLLMLLASLAVVGDREPR